MPGSPTNPEGVYLLDWEPSDGTVPTVPPVNWNAHYLSDVVPVRVRPASRANNEPVRAGLYSVRFELLQSDRWPPPPRPNPAARAELAGVDQSAPEPFEPVGAERWYGFSIYLPGPDEIYLPEGERNSEEWLDDQSAESVTQWHQVSDSGSPPLAIVTHEGKWKVSQRAWGDPNITRFVWEDRNHYETGRWTDWVVHVKWSVIGSDDPDPDDPNALDDPTAFLYIWKDGVLVFKSEGKKNAYLNQGNYMKIGIYKWGWSQGNPSDTVRRVMYLDEVRIADGSGSYEQVAPPPTPVPEPEPVPLGMQDTSVARLPDGRLELWAALANGGLWTRWKVEPDPNAYWTLWSDFIAEVGALPAGVRQVAVAPLSDGRLELWAALADGGLWTTWKLDPDPNANWSPWVDFVGEVGALPAGVRQVAVAPLPDGRLELWAVLANGALLTTWKLDPDPNANWSPWSDFLGEVGPLATGVQQVSAARLPDGRLELWATLANGGLSTTWKLDPDPNANWSPWADFIAEVGALPTGVQQVAVAPLSDGRLELWASLADGALWTTWKLDPDPNANWSPWVDFVGEVGALPAGVRQVAVAPLSDGRLELWAALADGALWTTWKLDPDPNANWSSWVDFVAEAGPPDQVILRSAIPDLDGWVEITLRQDGTVRFRGHVHNGGIQSFSFRVRVIVRAATLAVAMVYEGHVGGAQIGSDDPRDEDWLQTFVHPMVELGFSQFQNGSLEIQADTRGDITGWIEDAATFLGRFVVGTVLLNNPVVGFIVLGVEVAALIESGGFDTGARLIGGTLWLAGPQGTLLALASEGVAALGSEEREISQSEYDWANNEVFNGTLPPRERIILTDTIGWSDRPFVFPRFDEKITLNLGTQGYDNPLAPNFQATFIHELVHAWQLHNTHSALAFIGAGFSIQVCDVLGGDVYNINGIDGTQPFNALNIEQQGMVVEAWFNDPNKASNPYNGYVEENIRTGTA
jgi:polysaccharide lyase-like protein